MKGNEGTIDDFTPTLSSTSYALQEARRRRAAAAAGGDAAAGGPVTGSQSQQDAQAAAAPAPPAASGAMGAMKSLMSSFRNKGESEKEDTNNPFHKKKEPEVAIIDPDSYYAGARPATALGHGQYQSDNKFTNVSLDQTADASQAAKKSFRRGAKTTQPTQTLNMNIAPRRHSKDVTAAVQDFLISADADLDSSCSEDDDSDSSDSDTYHPLPPRKAAFFPFGESARNLGETTDKSSDTMVPVRSSKLALSQLCANVCKSWRKILIILFFLASVVSLGIIAIMEGWTDSLALSGTQTLKTAGNRKAKEIHTQFEWPRNGQDKDETYRNMLRDRSILAHNTQIAQPQQQDGPNDRAMMDANQQQLGFAYEQTGDGPWRVGFRDGLGGISKPPPDVPSQKYIIWYQQEQQRMKEQEELQQQQQQQQQQQEDIIQEEDGLAQSNEPDQLYRRIMQRETGLANEVVMVDKVVPQPVNLP